MAAGRTDPRPETARRPRPISGEIQTFGALKWGCERTMPLGMRTKIAHLRGHQSIQSSTLLLLGLSSLLLSLTSSSSEPASDASPAPSTLARFLRSLRLPFF